MVFIYKQPNAGFVISARDMTIQERRYYNAQKKGGILDSALASELLQKQLIGMK